MVCSSMSATSGIDARVRLIRAFSAFFWKIPPWGVAPGLNEPAPLALHNALTQQFVFSGEQILHEIETAFIGVARGAGEMMIDSHARRPAEIIRNGKNFVGWFTAAQQPLRV